MVVVLSSRGSAFGQEERGLQPVARKPGVCCLNAKHVKCTYITVTSSSLHLRRQSEVLPRRWLRLVCSARGPGPVLHPRDSTAAPPPPPRRGRQPAGGEPAPSRVPESQCPCSRRGRSQEAVIGRSAVSIPLVCVDGVRFPHGSERRSFHRRRHAVSFCRSAGRAGVCRAVPIPTAGRPAAVPASQAGGSFRATLTLSDRCGTRRTLCGIARGVPPPLLQKDTLSRARRAGRLL